MFKQIISSGIISVGLLFTGTATAHSAHGYHGHDFQVITPITHPAPRPVRHCVSGHRINKMQANQKYRIQQGKRHGNLVRWELKQLKQQRRDIKKAEQRMRNSHHCLTQKEENKLVKRLKRANRKIRELKRNNARYGRSYHRHSRH